MKLTVPKKDATTIATGLQNNKNVTVYFDQEIYSGYDFSSNGGKLIIDIKEK